MSIFLRMKHWQLFVLLIGLPIAIEFVMIASLFVFRDFQLILYFFPVLMVFSVGGIFGWLYVIGTNLVKKLPPNVNMNVTAFRTFLFIAVAYIVLFSLVFFWIFSIVAQGRQPNFLVFIGLFLTQFLYLFCIIYCFYFVAKTLKTVEWQKPTTFSDYVGEFFLIWFYPVGVWFIQPRINKLFDPSSI